MITCTKCNVPKEDECFNWRNKKKGRRHRVCRPCKKEQDNSYYASNKNRRKTMRKTANDLIRRNKRFVRLVRHLSKCSRCPEKRWYVLDFHHVRDKKIEICDMIRRCTSIENLKKELRKCIVLCSNCHREEHYLNGNEANLVEASD